MTCRKELRRLEAQRISQLSQPSLDEEVKEKRESIKGADSVPGSNDSLMCKKKVPGFERGTEYSKTSWQRELMWLAKKEAKDMLGAKKTMKKMLSTRANVCNNVVRKFAGQ